MRASVPPNLLAAPSFGYDVMSGDLNGDGRVDLVTTMPQADAVAVFLANTNGGFAPAVVYPAGDGAVEGVLADLNNDGRLDLVTRGPLRRVRAAQETAQVVSVRRSRCRSRRQSSRMFGSGEFNAGDPDGARSIWSIATADGRLHVMLQAANGTFSSAPASTIRSCRLRRIALSPGI